MTRARHKDYTLEELEELLLVTAELVDRYGDKFLIYFEFMEGWIATEKRKQSATDRAKALVKLHKPHP